MIRITKPILTIIFVTVMAIVSINQIAFGGELGAEASALLDQQATNISRIYNGEFKGNYNYWMDYGNIKGRKAKEIREYKTTYETIKVIGPPGGYARYDKLEAPLKINDKATGEFWEQNQRSVQNYFDTGRRLEYQPDAKFALLRLEKDTSVGNWMEVHPLFYGTTYQGRTLKELADNVDEVKILKEKIIDNVVSLQFAGVGPFETHIKIIVDMCTDKDLFISGYTIFRSEPGEEEMFLVEKISITPSKGPHDIWYPGKVTQECFQRIKDSSGNSSPRKVMSSTVEFEAIELNIPNLTPEDLQFDMAHGTIVIDQEAGIQYKVGQSLDLAQEHLNEFTDLVMSGKFEASEKIDVEPNKDNACKTIPVDSTKVLAVSELNQKEIPNTTKKSNVKARIFAAKKTRIIRFLLWGFAGILGITVAVSMSKKLLRRK